MSAILITHDEARDIVQRRAPDAVDAQSIEWDLLRQYNPTSGNEERRIKYDKLPASIRGRIDSAIVLRDKLNAQFTEADKWLRRHFPEYARPLVCKLQAQKTGTRAAVEPVMIDLAILEAKLIEEFGPAKDVAPSVGMPQRKGRAGPPEKYDWEEGKLYVMRELEQNGDPTQTENQKERWRTQTDVANKLRDHLEKVTGTRPDLTRARRKVKIWIEEFQRVIARN
jgi:hypothetical protein